MQLREIIKYVEGCQDGSPTSITLYNPHSWRGDYKQLGFDYKFKPSTKKEMLEVLRHPIDREYVGWKGGEYRMGLDSFVYLSSPGEGGAPLDLLMLQHIMGYVYPQTSGEHWIRPYLAGDRKNLEKMGKILLHATDETDMTEVWELAISMQTRVGHSSPEGYLADLQSLEGVHGDLQDAMYYYQDLCARLGEPEAENPYSNEVDKA